MALYAVAGLASSVSFAVIRGAVADMTPCHDAQRYDSGEMRFQFAFSLLMQFQFISVYCLFFYAKVRCRVMSGWGITGHQWAPMEIKVNTGKWRRKNQ